MFNGRIPTCCFSYILHSLSAEMQATPRAGVIVGDRLGSPSVNILFMTKLSLDPLFWDMDCLLTLWLLLIPCSLGNICFTFNFLIFMIVKRNSLCNSLHIITKGSLKHICSLRAEVPVSFPFSIPPNPWLFLWSIETHRAHSSTCAFKVPLRGHPVHSWAMQALCQGLYWSSV